MHAGTFYPVWQKLCSMIQFKHKNVNLKNITDTVKTTKLCEGKNN